jgi:hypothetical protein
MALATSDDADPANRGVGIRYRAGYVIDWAAEAIRREKARFREQHGENGPNPDDFLWFVTSEPKPPLPPLGT